MVDTRGQPIELDCPVCSKTGVAQAVDGVHSGTWVCKNNNCLNQSFVSSKMTFYDTKIKSEWRWEDLGL